MKAAAAAVPALYRLRHPNGRFRARGPVAAMPTYYDRHGVVRWPNLAERTHIGLDRRFLVEYARTHLPEPRYRDFVAGLRAGATDSTGPLL